MMCKRTDFPLKFIKVDFNFLSRLRASYETFIVSTECFTKWNNGHGEAIRG